MLTGLPVGGVKDGLLKPTAPRDRGRERQRNHDASRAAAGSGGPHARMDECARCCRRLPWRGAALDGAARRGLGCGAGCGGMCVIRTVAGGGDEAAVGVVLQAAAAAVGVKREARAQGVAAALRKGLVQRLLREAVKVARPPAARLDVAIRRDVPVDGPIAGPVGWRHAAELVVEAHRDGVARQVTGPHLRRVGGRNAVARGVLGVLVHSDRLLVQQDRALAGRHVAEVVAHDERSGDDRPDCQLRARLVVGDAVIADQQPAADDRRYRRQRRRWAVQRWGGSKADGVTTTARSQLLPTAPAPAPAAAAAATTAYASGVLARSLTCPRRCTRRPRARRWPGTARTSPSAR